ncbi:hypothetical protein HK405_007991, partial [Cladochytrium tenue]
WGGATGFTAGVFPKTANWTPAGASAPAGFLVDNDRGLTYVRVLGAGHMVPTDQPVAALGLVSKLLSLESTYTASSAAAVNLLPSSAHEGSPRAVGSAWSAAAAALGALLAVHPAPPTPLQELSSPDQLPPTAVSAASAAAVTSPTPAAPTVPPVTLAAANVGAAAPNPEETAPWWSFVALTWLTPFMRRAARAPLQFPDLFRLHHRFHADAVRERMQAYLAAQGLDPPGGGGDAEEDDDRKQKERAARVARALRFASFYVFPDLSAISLSLHFFSSFGAVASPLILAYFLSYLDNPNPRYLGYVYATALLVAQLMVAFGWNMSQYIQRNVAMSIKTAMISVTYAKALRMSPKARQEYSNGRIMNLVASDCSNLENFFTYMNDLCYIPFEVISQSILLLVFLRGAGAIGLAFLVIVVGLNSIFTTYAVKYERLALAATDNRVKLSSEVLSGMKIVKFFAWEEALLAQLLKLRENELEPQLVLRLVSATFTTLMTLIPAFTNVITFGCYYAFGNSIQASSVFTGLSILNSIRLPVALIPIIMQMFWSATVSMQRLGAFFTTGDIESPPTLHPSAEGGATAIAVRGATFVWPAPPHSENLPDDRSGADGGDDNNVKVMPAAAESEKEKPSGFLTDHSARTLSDADGADSATPPHPDAPLREHLRGLDFEIPKGKLTVIVGRVGAGKSSILHGIIGDMRRTQGSVDVFGRVALSTQTAWLQNATLRDNILFGTPFVEDRYWATVRACCLTKDLELLDAADLTHVGEKGVTLSGGQA